MSKYPEELSKYTYESDLRKYMGLDDAPSSKPLKLATGGSAKIRNDQYYADGGSTSEKKKDKKNEIGAVIGALAGVIGAGAAYMAYRNHKKNKQNAAGFNPHVGRHSHKAHGENFIANPGYDENSGYNGSASGELGVSAARQAGEKMRENLRKMREKESQASSSVMSNRPGGYKGEMNYDDFQNKYLDRYQDVESPAYRKKLQDFQNYGDAQVGGLTIDHAKKKKFNPALERKALENASRTLKENLRRNQEQQRLAMREAEREAALAKVQAQENAKMQQATRLKEKMNALKNLDTDSNL